MRQRGNVAGGKIHGYYKRLDKMKTKYESKRHTRLVEGLARRGLTDDQIAEHIGVTRKTLYEWRRKYPAFAVALAHNKDEADLQVEKSLFQRALGYDYTETKEIREGKKLVKTEKTVKHIAPDVTAQIFWLKNRRPDLWRDKREHHHEGSLPLVVVTDEAEAG